MFSTFEKYSIWATIVQIVCLLFCTAAIADQYHIQTDEGPERFFRFQTNNGQFRKEKRLPDGTVIGTEAWIDADGFLRLKDYMADKEGFRILKSKTVFVGISKPIDVAIKSTKSSNTKSDVLKSNEYDLNTQSNRVDDKFKHTQPQYSPTAVKTARIFTEEPILNYKTPSELLKLEPIPYLGFDHYPNELPAIPKSSQDTLRLLSHNKSTFATGNHRKIQAIAIAPIIPAPIVGNGVENEYSTLSTSNNPSYNAPVHFSTYSQQQPSSPSVLQADINALDDKPLPTLLPPLHKYGELSNNDVTFSRNGFRYVLPRQYHEEIHVDPNKKAGSFGYVDPFGIRRVVYYNASPDKGFVHRNHNTFVGINGNPYDEKKQTTDHSL